MQHAVAHALGWASHQVRVVCRRMGGGFGGKESQSAQFACIAALAAQQLQRPVKLRVDRDDDFLITGRRHCFEYDYEVGFDGQGRILAAEVTMMSRAGHSADLSAPVMTRALCHFDNAYWLPHVAMHGYSVKTNTQSNTAFRGFGGPQGAMVMENIIDSMARHLQRDALDVRRINFYAEPDSPAFAHQSTPYGQPVLDNVLQPLVAQLEASSRYRARRAEVNAFNATSLLLKRGLALTPVKFGIAFNLKHLNQAGALVHVYADGSILVNHGGTEMGQGLNTKVGQIVADELGVPFECVLVTASDTSKIPNASATAASAGTDLNARAAQYAARNVRDNLAQFVAGLDTCGAGAVRFAGGQVISPTQTRAFKDVVRQAYANRIQLWSDGFYRTPKIHYDKTTLTGRPFYYFAYGAACTEVAIDTLTGESRVLKVDILHDVGTSINPAIDIGQIEGGFVQGMGWLTTEQLVWNDKGHLSTHAPSTYKIPATGDIPEHFKVAFWPEPNREDNVFGSKAVGEPPFMLAISVFEAMKDAVANARADGGVVQLTAPATAENVLTALAGTALTTGQ
jgi:xanthine dehydrogenase large subunit